MTTKNPLVIREAYEPGNVTRYDILYVEWDNEKDERMYSLTVFHGAQGQSFSLRKDNYANAGYVSQKTGWEGADLAALLGYLKRKGVAVGYYGGWSEEFDEYGRWTPQEVADG